MINRDEDCRTSCPMNTPPKLKFDLRCAKNDKGQSSLSVGVCFREHVVSLVEYTCLCLQVTMQTQTEKFHKKWLTSRNNPHCFSTLARKVSFFRKVWLPSSKALGFASRSQHKQKHFHYTRNRSPSAMGRTDFPNWRAHVHVIDDGFLVLGSPFVVHSMSYGNWMPHSVEWWTFSARCSPRRALGA